MEYLGIFKTIHDTEPSAQNVLEQIPCIDIIGDRSIPVPQKTYAMACPSEVEVPRPSSSRATNELRVAEDCIHHQTHLEYEYFNQIKFIYLIDLKYRGLTSIVAVSESSVKNVLWPAMILSLAPMRTKIRSTGDKSKLSAGTSAPTCRRKHVIKLSNALPHSFAPQQFPKKKTPTLLPPNIYI
ncbi:hypothetical protein Ahy_B06g080669 isoform B [Arachis hypogaea]|uniref:Uncharacterized protein n=1 Tax=Arachis hypogaea TaxID=3818 RepID=A0A444YIU9_ARAHY|nr:hypothetical protein Ahy_B06g080669 isoform B [Arachis hypogaea]